MLIKKIEKFDENFEVCINFETILAKFLKMF